MAVQPQWDNKNIAGVPSARLTPNTLTPKSTHTRSPSFLSSFRSKSSSSSQEPMQTTQPQHAQQQGQQQGQQPQQSTPPQQQAYQPQPQPQRRVSISSARLPFTSGTDLHPEIKSVVSLALAHAHKVYFSGPLVRQVERLPDGSRPSKDEGWKDVWAQLGGTTLSIWDMKEIEEANKRGEEVPPTYINVTDAFVQVLGSVTIPATENAPAQRYTNVLTLNTAGSNLLLFSCPNATSLVSWASALRLSAWEKSRLEEIYTAHLLRMSLSENGQWREPNTTLSRGRLEGWGQIRVAGQTDWKRAWMVLTSPEPVSNTLKRNRMSSMIFARPNSPTNGSMGPVSLALYTSNKLKDRKRALLTVLDITQAFAVFPERPELINRSTLIKIEGRMGDEEAAGGMKGREGWILIMPEIEGSKAGTTEMLKWIIALHDAFGMYGRPQAYTWDPRDPISMMFAYPVGPHRDHLFLDRELSEGLDPRDDRTSVVRSRLINVLIDRMRGPLPVLTPQQNPSAQRLDLPQIPALDFNQGSVALGNGSPRAPGNSTARTSLSPIAEAKSLAHSTVSDLQLPSRVGTSDQTQQQQGGPLPPLREQEPSAVLDISPGSLQAAGAANNSVGPPSRTRSPESKLSGPSPPTLGSPPTSMDAAQFPLPISTVGVAFPSHSHPQAYPTSYSTSQQPPQGNIPDAVSSPQPHVMQLNRSTPPPSSLGSNYTLSGPVNGSHLVSSSSGTTLQQQLPPLSQAVPIPSKPSPHMLPPIRTTDLQPASRNPPPLLVTAPSVVLPAPSSSSKPAQPLTNVVHKEQHSSSSNEYRFDNEAGALYVLQQDMQEKAEAVIPVAVSPPIISVQQPSAATVLDTPQPSTNTTSNDLGVSQALPETSQNGSLGKNPTSMQTAISFDRATSATATGTGGYNAFEQQYTATLGVTKATAGSVSHVSNRIALGRKPSGARPLSTNYSNTRRNFAESSHNDSVLLIDPDQEKSINPPNQNLSMSQSHPPLHDSLDNADALAALRFVDQKSSPPLQPQTSNDYANSSRGEGHPPSAPASNDLNHYPSSFTPSNKQVARIAKLQAQQEAASSAISKPGRSNGRSKAKKKQDAWDQSSEDEEEDDEDDEDGSDAQDAGPTSGRLAGGPSSGSQHSSGIAAPQPQNRTLYGTLSKSGSYGELGSRPGVLFPDGQQRPPRVLPAIPGSSGNTRGAQDEQRESDPASRLRTHYDEPASLRRPAERSPHGPPRQSMWSTVLDPSTHVTPAAQKDTFVTIEPNETITKAFTQQGLLRAGMQDKQDRSAKKQEEHARETGASLINVPSKPPPPQTGLLGAITAHERDRKREGGVGAALTERERERRLAEERQRKLDDLQHQHLTQAMNMGQGGPSSAYDPYNAGQHYPGYNPMMMPMMPMVPLLTGYGGPMLTPWGTNPQQQQYQMWAAQAAAAQAYQQALMSFSQAGSATPSEIGDPANQATPGTGPDPRQSIMWGIGGPPMMPSGLMGGMPMMGGMAPMGSMPPVGMGVPVNPMGSMSLISPPGQPFLHSHDASGNSPGRPANNPHIGSPLVPPRSLDDNGRNSAGHSPASSSPRHGPIA